MSETIIEQRVNRAQFCGTRRRAGSPSQSEAASSQASRGRARQRRERQLDLAGGVRAETLRARLQDGARELQQVLAPKLMNIDYFQKALIDEQAHLAFLGNALDRRPERVNAADPPSAVKSDRPCSTSACARNGLRRDLPRGGRDAVLGHLKLVAAKVGPTKRRTSASSTPQPGHGVLPPLPSTVTVAQAASTLTPYIPNLTARLERPGSRTRD